MFSLLACALNLQTIFLVEMNQVLLSLNVLYTHVAFATHHVFSLAYYDGLIKMLSDHI